MNLTRLTLLIIIPLIISTSCKAEPRKSYKPSKHNSKSNLVVDQNGKKYLVESGKSSFGASRTGKYLLEMSNGENYIIDAGKDWKKVTEDKDKYANRNNEKEKSKDYMTGGSWYNGLRCKSSYNHKRVNFDCSMICNRDKSYTIHNRITMCTCAGEKVDAVGTALFSQSGYMLASNDIWESFTNLMKCKPKGGGGRRCRGVAEYIRQFGMEKTCSETRSTWYSKPEPEPYAEPEPETRPTWHWNSKPEPEPYVEPEPETRPTWHSKPEPEPYVEPETRPTWHPKPEPEPYVEPEPETRPSWHSKPEPEPYVEPEPITRHNWHSKPEPEPYVEPETRPTWHSKPEPEPYVEPEPETRPNWHSKPILGRPKPIYRPKTWVHARPEPEPEYRTRPEPEPEYRARPEPEPEYLARPEPEPEYRAWPEPEPRPEPEYHTGPISRQGVY